MSVRMRINKSQTGNRRSHHALAKPAITRDGEKGGLALRHRVSPITGTYKGKQVLDVEKRTIRREKRVKRISDESPSNAPAPKKVEDEAKDEPKVEKEKK